MNDTPCCDFRCKCKAGKVTAAPVAPYLLARAEVKRTGERVQFAPGWWVSVVKDEERKGG